MEKIILANWKANLSLEQAEKWLERLQADYVPRQDLRVIIAVPAPFLIALRRKFSGLSWLHWAAQDVSPYPPGSYTGSVPAAWLNGQVEYVLVGHQERRKYFHESVQDVANKMTEALAEDISPIVCLDLDTMRQQAATVEFEDMQRLFVAYTPAEADSLEIARGTESVTRDIARIAALFPGAPLLYGGGVNERNVASLLALPQLSGVMVAGGCLDPYAFIRLLQNGGAALGSQ